MFLIGFFFLTFYRRQQIISILEFIKIFLKKLSFTEEELAKYQIFEDGDGRVKWKNSTRKTFDICSKIYDIVCAYLEDCKKKNLLEEEHMELYEKFHR